MSLRLEEVDSELLECDFIFLDFSFIGWETSRESAAIRHRAEEEKGFIDHHCLVKAALEHKLDRVKAKSGNPLCLVTILRRLNIFKCFWHHWQA